MDEKPYGPIDPNSQHQLWSRWTFVFWDTGKHPTIAEVKENAAKWMRMGFGSVGRGRVTQFTNVFGMQQWTIEAEVEGVPAHDPQYKEHVRAEFKKNFLEKGWGLMAAFVDMKVAVLAGDIQDGSPPSQMVVFNLLSLPKKGDDYDS